MSGRSITLRDTFTSTRQLNIPATLSTPKSYTVYTRGQLTVSHFTCGNRPAQLCSNCETARTVAY